VLASGQSIESSREWDMTGERERVQNESRRAVRPRQPPSLTGLRPSQRRAAEHRATLARERAAEHWLSRLAANARRSR
jgi:hypothetical protein